MRIRALALGSVLLATAAVAGPKQQLQPPGYLPVVRVATIEKRCEETAQIAMHSQGKEKATKTYRWCLIGHGWEWSSVSPRFR